MKIFGYEFTITKVKTSKRKPWHKETGGIKCTRWAQQEDDYVRNSKATTEFKAKKLGRSVSAVQNRMSKLKKDAENVST